MAQFYYLISSLPMLTFDEVPSIDTPKFLDFCDGFVLPEELEALTELSLSPSDLDGGSRVSEWSVWETLLRNRLVIKRGKPGVDTDKYLRNESDCFSEIDKGVQEAYLKSDPLEREDLLDQMRWTRLEDLEVGHEFDFKKLCLYKIKLMLCEKRTGRNKDRGSDNYDNIIETIYGVNPTDPPQIEEHGKI